MVEGRRRTESIVVDGARRAKEVSIDMPSSPAPRTRIFDATC